MKEGMYNEVYARYLNSQNGLIGFHHKINTKVETRKVREVLKPEDNDRILEIGCNAGYIVHELLVHSQNVVGIDINYTALKTANMPNLFCMDVTDMGFRDNSFDKIVCLHTIEHVQEIERAFEEMGRILKPGGRVLLIYPFEIMRGLGCLGGAMSHILATYSSKWYALVTCSVISKAREIHIHRLSPRKINRLITESSLILAGNYMILDPFLSYLTILEKRE